MQRVLVIPLGVVNTLKLTTLDGKVIEGTDIPISMMRVVEDPDHAKLDFN